MTDQTPRVPDDADQPDGIADDSYDLPDKARAAGRVNEFLAWFGDGRLYPCVLPGTEDEMPPLFARDLQALTNAATADAAQPEPAEGLRAAVLSMLKELSAYGDREQQTFQAQTRDAPLHRAFGRGIALAVQRIRAIVDREAGRA